MIARLNWVAKAAIAFGVPAGTLVADLALQWTNVTADGSIVANEWILLVMALVSGVAVFKKANGPAPA